MVKRRRRRRWQRGALGLAVVLTAASAACAATATSGLDRIRTRYYRLHTDLPTEEARDLAKFLDQMFVSYARIFKYKEHRKAPLDVYVFSSREGFVAYGESKGLGARVMGLRGFFSLQIKAMASYGSGDELRKVLAHEGTHQFITLVTKLTHQPPLWFHEGLATYFETASWQDGKLTLGALNRERLGALALMCSEGRFVPIIPLRHLLAARQFTPFHYAEAWSFVYFLLRAEGGRNADVLNRYFILIQQREDPVEAFAKAFRAPLDKVEEVWRTYVDQLLKKHAPQPPARSAGTTNPPSH